jgi:hypothetical protein
MLRPNYSKSVCKLSEDFFIAMIKYLGDLFVLTHEPYGFNISGRLPKFQCNIGRDGNWAYLKHDEIGCCPDF